MDKIVDALSRARRVLVFTGAGISTGSGIPDFRGPEGVWKRRKPVMIDEFLGSHESRQDYWDYKLEGYPAFCRAEPNAAHESLVELQRSGRLLGVITQNVDGLHSRAGIDDEKLIEIHGTNRKVTCLDCGDEADPAALFEDYRLTREPPVCASCGGWLKPATISFGQPLLQDDMERAGEWSREADFVMSLGSTLSVQPAASFPLLAQQVGASYLVVNQGETDHDRVADYRLDGDLVVLVPRLIASLGLK